MFGLAEAKALIIRHRDVVLAIANGPDGSPHARCRHDPRDHRPRAGARPSSRLGADVRERVIV
jgi:hypothetical protein